MWLIQGLAPREVAVSGSKFINLGKNKNTNLKTLKTSSEEMREDEEKKEGSIKIER